MGRHPANIRRGEADWIQVVVRMLDHTFALHSAAAHTGQTAFTAQLAQFQNALRDTARRVGLTPFTAAVGEPFDAARHRTSDSQQPEPGDTVGETLATGFTFRGQLIRPALVALATPQTAATTPAVEARETASVTEEPTLL